MINQIKHGVCGGNFQQLYNVMGSKHTALSFSPAYLLNRYTGIMLRKGRNTGNFMTILQSYRFFLSSLYQLIKFYYTETLYKAD